MSSVLLYATFLTTLLEKTFAFRVGSHDQHSTSVVAAQPTPRPVAACPSGFNYISVQEIASGRRWQFCVNTRPRYPKITLPNPSDIKFKVLRVGLSKLFPFRTIDLSKRTYPWACLQLFGNIPRNFLDVDSIGSHCGVPGSILIELIHNIAAKGIGKPEDGPWGRLVLEDLAYVKNVGHCTESVPSFLAFKLETLDSSFIGQDLLRHYFPLAGLYAANMYVKSKLAHPDDPSKWNVTSWYGARGFLPEAPNKSGAMLLANAESKQFVRVLDQNVNHWLTLKANESLFQFGIREIQEFFDQAPEWLSANTTVGEAIDYLNSEDTRGKACKVLHRMLQETFVEGCSYCSPDCSVNYYGLASHIPDRRHRVYFYEEDGQ